MRLVLCLLLALAAAPAWAAWMAMGEGSNAVLYFDPATIRRDGNLSRVWEIHDFKQRGRSGEMSLQSLTEYDCKEERYRFLSSSLHTNPMASGRVLILESELSNWYYIPPNTTAQLIRRIVCAK